MEQEDVMKASVPISRRAVLGRGGSALAGLALFDSPLFAAAAEGERTIPFLDQPGKPPIPLPHLLEWQSLDAWITPNEGFFAISHYGEPKVDVAGFRLKLGGLVANPKAFTLAEIKAFPRVETAYTLECSGNSGFDWFQGGIGNARWGGTPLAAVLQKAGVKKGAVEVVFYGADKGPVTIPYISGLGDKIADLQTEMAFARSMTLEEAMDPDNLLCYEMNGAPLPAAHGFPLRLVAPRWYGIANVKWLTRIEVSDQRFLGPFMTEKYVTVREETSDDGSKVLKRSSVGKSQLKSMTAKVTVKDGRHRIHGAAWGGPVARVEVKVDDGPWKPATIDPAPDRFAWKFWHVDWSPVPAGEHTITSRSIDTAGTVQPAMDDPAVAAKKTYWEANGQITRRVRIG
jgi:DMSO/TMAO reductase YedYZ molybdopterin-dependent catalytic subunit